MNKSSKEQRSLMYDSIEPRVYPTNRIIGIINSKEDIDNVVKSLFMTFISLVKEPLRIYKE